MNVILKSQQWSEKQWRKPRNGEKNTNKGEEVTFMTAQLLFITKAEPISLPEKSLLGVTQDLPL